jgi:outer membrane protein assembly factor BamA
MFLANIELRTPFPQGFGINAPNFLPITLAVFFDAGAAWWTQDTALRIGGNKDPWNLITSYGVAARINLFGLMLMEIDFVHPNNRPQKGWIWQFGFSPGF